MCIYTYIYIYNIYIYNMADGPPPPPRIYDCIQAQLACHRGASAMQQRARSHTVGWMWVLRLASRTRYSIAGYVP